MVESFVVGVGNALGGRPHDLIKSKVIVLLTDGENNSGEQSPLVAAALAKEWGIKIYTISLGEKPSNLKLEIQGEAIVVPPDESVTEETLRKMAEMTGGIFRTAYDLDSLESVYAEIDQLERSDLRPIQYADREEVFWMFALFGVLGLVVELGLRSTVFRRVP